MAAEDFDKQSAHFLDWFRSLPGSTFHDDIEIRDLRSRNAGRGIVAKRDIEEDTVLFTIPRKDIICAANSELSQKLPAVFENFRAVDYMSEDEEEGARTGDRTQDPWTSLILVMIYEHLRGDASPWKPYLDVLPTSFETPMFWSAAELKELQASPVVASVGREEADRMIRTVILPVIRENEAVFFTEGAPRLDDEELMRLAHRMGSTIMAYAFDLEKDEDDDGEGDENEDGWVEDKEGHSLMGMVPMADILNADAEFNAHINHAETALVATALRKISAGEEILNYYGPLSNGQLCRRYGYTTSKHSRYDIAEVAWKVVLDGILSRLNLTRDEWAKTVSKDKSLWSDEEDTKEETATFEIERENNDPDDSGRLPPAPAADSKPLISLELLDRIKRVTRILKKAAPSSASMLEQSAARHWIQHSAIRDAIDSKLKEYGTSLEEDLQLFEGIISAAEPSQNGQEVRKRMALEVRVGEKKLLAEARVWLEQQAEAARLEMSSDTDKKNKKKKATAEDQDMMDIDDQEDSRSAKKQRRV